MPLRAWMTRLSSVFTSLPPRIEPLEISEGLLAFRCSASLPFGWVAVSHGAATQRAVTRVCICSKEPETQVYRAQWEAGALQQAWSELGGRLEPRLAQAVRVASPDLRGFFALTEDVSTGGVRLATPERLVAGTVLPLRLDLDDPRLPCLAVRGEVRWSAIKADGTCHSGIRFLDLERTQERNLARYIESRLAARRVVHGEGRDQTARPAD